MSSQNPWDVLVDVQPKQQPYQEVAEKFPELAPQEEDINQSPWAKLSSAPETGLEKTERVGAQLATRAVEQLYGFPGDVEKFGRNLLNIPAKKLPYMEKDFKVNEPLVSKDTFLPTSHELRQRTKEKFKGKFEPKSEIEEMAGNVIGKYVISPGGPLLKAAVAEIGRAHV